MSTSISHAFVETTGVNGMGTCKGAAEHPACSLTQEHVLYVGLRPEVGSKTGHIQDGPLVPLETQVGSTALGSQQRLAGSLNRNTVLM